jgi:hypothetical protein
MSYWQLFVRRICHRLFDGALAGWAVTLSRLFTHKARQFMTIQHHIGQYESSSGVWKKRMSSNKSEHITKALFSVSTMGLDVHLLMINKAASYSETLAHLHYTAYHIA